ncbi:16S rRNA (guanine(527)-N(7))-methyltransferase RsmG [Cumulibacter manganitolerans]|uniref:16S rRNA (guanine(527)-N(7))-methyltransferase RsmG n=1 Tax=Cumulibacter manganitolerans TaxID=1884992 RepID=UPI001294D958|nr:16S rRNA (guanine(527)-N(7))-methyltransferase RsmG [Cumulibacter manganitolerans]
MQPTPASAAAIFGERLPLAERFHASLSEAGPIRGLNGPRELPVLWDRHIINSALLAFLPVRILPSGATVCDVGSGGGLPGIPLAIARPDLLVTLVDPLQRRTDYLREIVTDLGLENVRVVRARAGEPSSPREIGRYAVVTSRAVAPLGRLLEWCVPLTNPDGFIAAMKGRSVEREIGELSPRQRALVTGFDILDLASPDGVHSARVLAAQPRSSRRIR